MLNSYYNYFVVAKDNQARFIHALLVLFIVSVSVDFILGVGNALFNRNVKFLSGKMKIGLMVKICEIGVTMFILIPIGIIFGDIGLDMVRIMLIGMVLGEVYSLLGHFGVVDDSSRWLDNANKFLKNVKKD